MKQCDLKSGLLDRHRKLVLTEEYVEFENKDLIGQEFTRFNKTDIVDFKHGMDWIVWYKFTVGRQFSITFKDKRGKELKIMFKSYFGLNSHYHQLYSDIVDDIWTYYHKNIVDRYLDRFYNNEELKFSRSETESKRNSIDSAIFCSPVGKSGYERILSIFGDL